MKFLYQINVIFFIIMAILFVIPWFGMLFMIPVGALQLLSSLYLFIKYKKLSERVNTFVITHLVCSAITLISLFSFFQNMRDTVIIIGLLVISGILSIFFLYTLRTNHKELYKLN